MITKGSGVSGAGVLAGFALGVLGVWCVWVGAHVGARVGFGEIALDSDAVMRGCSMSWYADGGWVDEREPGRERGGRDRALVILVHGLDEPGGIWDDLAPALDRAGLAVVRFEYPNDQRIRVSAAGFFWTVGRELGGAADRWGRADIVAHSMGGLVTREALTNPVLGAGSGEIGGVRIGRVITVGTPHGGSRWAALRGVAELRERVQRFIGSEDWDPGLLMGAAVDGRGEAGEDLMPGSRFLTELDARGWAAGVELTCIVGRVVDPIAAGGLDARARRVLGDLGDGVVSVDSAVMDGCTDVVVVTGNHRGMLRTVEMEEGWRLMTGAEAVREGGGAPAIGVVLERLGDRVGGDGE